MLGIQTILGLKLLKGRELALPHYHHTHGRNTSFNPCVKATPHHKSSIFSLSILLSTLWKTKTVDGHFLNDSFYFTLITDRRLLSNILNRQF